MSQPGTPLNFGSQSSSSQPGNVPGGFKYQGDNGHSENASNAVTDSTATNSRQLLNAYVYDFLIKSNLTETARAFYKEADVPTKEGKSPDLPDDMPPPPVSISMVAPHGFLYEWWQIFWDVFNARTHRGGSNSAQQYFQLNLLRQRQEHGLSAMQSNTMPQQGVPPQMMTGKRQNAARLQQQAAQQQMSNLRHQQQMGSSPNTQQKRPPADTPGSISPPISAPAPSMAVPSPVTGPKKMVYGAQGPQMGFPNNMMNAQMMMQQQQQQRAMMSNGNEFHDLSMLQRNNLPMQHPVGQNGMGSMMGQKSEMGQNSIVQNGLTQNAMSRQQGPQINRGNNINALQDYQKQLMLLERQNRKRLDVSKNIDIKGEQQSPIPGTPDFRSSNDLSYAGMKNFSHMPPPPPNMTAASPALSSQPAPINTAAAKRKKEPAKRRSNKRLATNEPPTPTTPLTPNIPNPAKKVGATPGKRTKKKEMPDQEDLADEAVHSGEDIKTESMPGASYTGDQSSSGNQMQFFNDFSTTTATSVSAHNGAAHEDMEFDFNSFLNTEGDSNGGLSFGGVLGWGDGVETDL